jgi:hypothetical protein
MEWNAIDSTRTPYSDASIRRSVNRLVCRLTTPDCVSHDDRVQSPATRTHAHAHTRKAREDGSFEGIIDSLDLR